MGIVGTSDCSKDVLEGCYRPSLTSLSFSLARGARKSVTINGVKNIAVEGEEWSINEEVALKLPRKFQARL